MNTADLLAEARRETTSKERLQELASFSIELAEAVAQNVAAPSDLLSKLAKHDRKNVRKVVTSNPKTPKKILFNLGVFFPQELLNNPIFDASLLGDLSFIRKIPSGVLSILVQQNNIPKFLLNYAANHPAKKVSNTAKMHVDISGEITEGWHEAVDRIIKEDADAFVYQFINAFYGVIKSTKGGQFRTNGNDETPRKSFGRLSIFHEFITPFFWSILLNNRLLKRYTAQNPSTELIVLKQLAFDEDYYVRWDVAENRNTSAEILRLLAEDSDSRVRNSVAGNRNTPVEILKSFATASDIEILYRLAGNPSTPVETIESLISDRHNSMLKAVAGNPSTPAEILELLADNSKDWFDEYVANNFNQYPETNSNYTKKDAISSEYKGIIENIAKNPSTPIKVLRTLASDAGYWMRKYIAQNPNAPADILKSFVDFEDGDNGVHSLVAKHPNTPTKVLELYLYSPKDLWKHGYYNIRESVAENPNTPKEILESLAEEQNIRIRFRVAINPNTPIDLLKTLANDSNHQIREAVAKNPNTPLEILEKLANDRNLIVRESVSENPNCTFKIKKTIFKNFAKSETPSFSRVALFLSDYAASFVLSENSNSISWLERYAIAQNQNTLRDTLEVLAQDGNRIVRATAKESLEKLNRSN